MRLPYVFVNDTVADADEVSANFEELFGICLENRLLLKIGGLDD